MNFRNIFRPCVLYKISSSYIPAFIQNGNQMKLIVPVFQMVDGTPIIGIKNGMKRIFNACVDLRLRIAQLRKNVAIVCGQGNCCHKSAPFVVQFWLNIAGCSGKIKGDRARFSTGQHKYSTPAFHL